MPFFRSRTNACSKLPLASVKAFLQSIMGAPDLFAELFYIVRQKCLPIVVLIRTLEPQNYNLRFKSFKVIRVPRRVASEEPIRGPIEVATLKLCNLETLQTCVLLNRRVSACSSSTSSVAAVGRLRVPLPSTSSMRISSPSRPVPAPSDPGAAAVALSAARSASNMSSGPAFASAAGSCSAAA